VKHEQHAQNKDNPKGHSAAPACYVLGSALPGDAAGLAEAYLYMVLVDDVRKRYQVTLNRLAVEHKLLDAVSSRTVLNCDHEQLVSPLTLNGYRWPACGKAGVNSQAIVVRLDPEDVLSRGEVAPRRRAT
jgi:hypothetical protein